MTLVGSDEGPAPQPRAERLSIARLGLHTVVSRFVVYTVTAVGTVLVARALGPAERGHYYLPVMILNVAFWAGNLGGEQAQLRTWGRRVADPDDFVATAWCLTSLQGAVTAAVTAGAYVLGRESVFEGVEPVDIAVVLLVLPLQMHNRLLTGLLTLTGRLRQANVAWVVGALAQSGGIAALFFADRLTVVSALVLFDLGVVVLWVGLLWSVRAVGHVRRPVPWRFVWSQLWLGARIHPYLVFIFLNVRFDIFLVARYLDLRAVGIYSVAVTFAEMVFLVTEAMVTGPMHRQANAPEDEALDVTLRAARMNLLLAVLAGGALVVAAPVVIPLVFGADYGSADRVVWVLVLAVGGLAVWRPVSTALLRFAAPRLQAGIGLGALVANVGANMVLIPHFGIVGAAWASVLSYWLGAIASVAWLATRRPMRARDLVPAGDEVRLLLGLRHLGS
jgi:O-antigen/teichoic acid export membrane protein